MKHNNKSIVYHAPERTEIPYIFLSLSLCVFFHFKDTEIKIKKDKT